MLMHYQDAKILEVVTTLEWKGNFFGPFDYEKTNFYYYQSPILQFV